MLYSCETSGMSDTTLHEALKVSSALVAPPTAGKNPKLVMHATKMHSDAVDPRMIGNVAPIATWATAWWEGWSPNKNMLDAFRNVTASAGTAKKVAWNFVTGPCRALVATCQRLGWTTSDGRVFTDDIGVQWDVALDPPQALARAAKRSVGRLCLDEVLKELPMAKPAQDDIRHHSSHTANLRRKGCRTTILVDLATYLKPLYRGGKRCLKLFPKWMGAGVRSLPHVCHHRRTMDTVQESETS